MFHEAVDLVWRRVQQGRVDTLRKGSVTLAGADLTKERIGAEAREIAEQHGGWLRVEFKGSVAKLMPPVSAGAEEEFQKSKTKFEKSYAKEMAVVRKAEQGKPQPYWGNILWHAWSAMRLVARHAHDLHTLYSDPRRKAPPEVEKQRDRLQTLLRDEILPVLTAAYQAHFKEKGQEVSLTLGSDPRVIPGDTLWMDPFGRPVSTQEVELLAGGGRIRGVLEVPEGGRGSKVVRRILFETPASYLKKAEGGWLVPPKTSKEKDLLKYLDSLGARIHSGTEANRLLQQYRSAEVMKKKEPPAAVSATDSSAPPASTLSPALATAKLEGLFKLSPGGGPPSFSVIRRRWRNLPERKESQVAVDEEGIVRFLSARLRQPPEEIRAGLKLAEKITPDRPFAEKQDVEDLVKEIRLFLKKSGLDPMPGADTLPLGKLQKLADEIVQKSDPHEPLLSSSGSFAVAVEFALSLLQDGATDANVTDSLSATYGFSAGAEEKVLKGHRGSVVSVVFSHDPKFKILASAGKDGTVRFWDWDSGAERFPAIPHAGVWQATFRASAHAILMVSPDSAESWNIPHSYLRRQGVKVRTNHLAFERPIASAEDVPYPGSVAFSPGRTSVLVGGTGGEAVIHNLDEKRAGPALLQRIRPESGSPLSVAYLTEPDRGKKDPDGRVIALGTSEGTVELWNIRIGREAERLQILKGHEGKVVSVGFDPTGKMLASADDRGVVRIWVWETTSFHEVRHAVPEEVQALAFSPDGGTLASAGTAGSVWFWDVLTGRPKGMIPGDIPVSALAFRPDGKWIAAGRRDNTIRLWKIPASAGAEEQGERKRRKRRGSETIPLVPKDLLERADLLQKAADHLEQFLADRIGASTPVSWDDLWDSLANLADDQGQPVTQAFSRKELIGWLNQGDSVPLKEQRAPLSRERLEFLHWDLIFAETIIDGLLRAAKGGILSDERFRRLLDGLAEDHMRKNQSFARQTAALLGLVPTAGAEEVTRGVVVGEENRQLPVVVYRTPRAIGRVQADEVMELWERAIRAKRPFVIGLPTGATPEPLLDELVDRLEQMPDPAVRIRYLQRLTLVAMDDANARRFFQERFLRRIPGAQVFEDSQLIVPKVDQVTEQVRQIKELGGIAWQMMATDGITLTLDNFVDLLAEDGKISFAAFGKGKAGIVQRFIADGRYESQRPISFLWLPEMASRTELLLDQEAASQILPEIRPPPAGAEEGDEEAYRWDPTYANYLRLSEMARQRLRERIEQMFQPIGAASYHDFAYNRSDYGVPDRVRDLAVAAEKAREILEGAYPDSGGFHLVALGDSGALLTLGIEAIHQTRSSAAVCTFTYLPISRDAINRADLRAVRAYQQFLTGVLNPRAVVSRPGRTVLLDALFTGKTLRFFLDVLEKLAQEEGISLEALQEKMAVHTLEDSYKDDFEEQRRATRQNLKYPSTAQIVPHRFYQSVTSAEVQFGDRQLPRLGRLDQAGGSFFPSEKALLTIFAFHDYLASLGKATPTAGLEEGRVLQEIPALLQFPPSDVRHRQVHIFDPENADVGRLAAALIADPVVIIARDARHEELLLKSGFSGPGRYLARLDTFAGIGDARRIVARDFASYDPWYYTAGERRNLLVWLAGILERYNIPDSILSLDGAQERIKALEVLRAV